MPHRTFWLWLWLCFTCNFYLHSGQKRKGQRVHTHTHTQGKTMANAIAIAVVVVPSPFLCRPCCFWLLRLRAKAKGTCRLSGGAGTNHNKQLVPSWKPMPYGSCRLPADLRWDQIKWKTNTISNNILKHVNNIILKMYINNMEYKEYYIKYL